MFVLGGPANECKNGQQHGNRWNGEPYCPGNAVLDVNHNSDCQQRAKIDCKVKPVEETFLLFPILRAKGEIGARALNLGLFFSL